MSSKNLPPSNPELPRQEQLLGFAKGPIQNEMECNKALRREAAFFLGWGGGGGKDLEVLFFFFFGGGGLGR